MSRFQVAFFSILVLVIVAHPLLAASSPVFYVGSCSGNSFGSISAAIASSTVPTGSIIKICPGTYSEQVLVDKAVTLQGISAFNSSQVLITMPSSVLNSVSGIYFATVAAQITVTTGPVKITNITVDGSTNTNCPTVPYAGIYYSSGSSGTVNEVETRNQSCNSHGIGVLAENGAAASPALFTLQNSNLHDASDTDILTCSDQFPTTLTATVKGNDVSIAPLGISTQCNAGGTVTGNVVHGATSVGIYAIASLPTISGNTVNDSPYGIWVGGGGLAVSGNTVNNASYGIALDAPATITSNKVLNSRISGIYLRNNGATIKSNTVTKSPVAIEFNCATAAVTNNAINGATTGFDLVPASFAGANNFFNVVTVRAGGC